MNKYKAADHTKLVDELFESIFKKYDLMNDVMSLGLHRLYKRKAMKHCAKGNLLDLAAGTGDLAIYFRRLFGSDNQIVLADPNSEMLGYAKYRLTKKYIFENIEYVKTYAEKLPFEDECFDNVSIGFGLRNFTDREQSLKEIYRVLNKKGNLVIIDFSKPVNTIIKYFNSLYLKYTVPFIAKLITGNIDEYRYLSKSIEELPSQTEIIELLESVGFINCNYTNYLNGSIAIHIANK